MQNVFLRSKPTRVEPAVLGAQLGRALADRLPAAAIDVAVGEGEVTLAWEDGPSAGTVSSVVATVVNWEVRTPAATPTKRGAPAVLLDRRFSERALAVAVIRYQASHVRPYDSTRAEAVADLVTLLDVDGPMRSGYPVPDAMAELLLAAPDPDDLAEQIATTASPADRLATKLRILGYDRLWSSAWGEVT